jgi:hypothetical protein
VIASVAFAVFENFELCERYENIYQIKNVFVLFVIVDHVSHTCCAKELFTMTCQGNCRCFLLGFLLRQGMKVRTSIIFTPALL